MRAPALVQGTDILLMGGEIELQGLTDAIQVYDTTSNTWSTSATMLPAPMRGFAAGIIDGTIYIADGNLAGGGVAPHHTRGVVAHGSCSLSSTKKSLYNSPFVVYNYDSFGEL